ncbi:MAG: DNA polymerase III subunit delta' [Hyphomicrobiaceae bacterium]|nr:DNA polymerase III subunit delta' [Hyphomicrobiaceae bacterium]
MAGDPDKPGPDALEGFPHPRERSQLFGHGEAEEQFARALASHKLHHAWLLLGKEGIGKATLAYRFAKLVLSRANQSAGDSRAAPPIFDPTSRDVQLITADAHPNLLVLRRSWNKKTKKYAAQISVDNVRELHRFLGNTAGMGKWRVVIVDRADDLNMNAANALLKMLEEPPAFCLFLLLSSEPGKLPATIRSRCHKLRLEGLERRELEAALKDIAAGSGTLLPEGEQLHTLLDLADGSVRSALSFATGRTLDDFREIEHILDLLPRVDPQKSIEIAERLAVRANDQNYHSFVHLLSSQLANRIRQIVLKGQGDKPALAQWTRLWETISIQKSETDLLNLDRGNFMLDLFARIEETAANYGGLKL